jgi:hypothetical protein
MGDLVVDFATLFAGRGDIYGADHGECVYSTVTREVMERHLSGEEPIGIYPIRPEANDGVRWGCLDIDEEDFQAAENYRLALESVGITGWVEITKSAHYHVWVFASEWVPAAMMKRALTAVRDAVGLQWVKEVNPKREDSAKKGNYVRLPYPGSRWSADRQPVKQMMLWWPGASGRYDDIIPLLEFVPLALESRVSAAQLEPIAKLWQPSKVIREVDIDYEIDEDVAALLDAASPIVRQIWHHGPLPHADRSGTIVRLAAKCRDCDLNESQSYRLLYTADERWGKYVEQGRPEELDRIIASVFSS